MNGGTSINNHRLWYIQKPVRSCLTFRNNKNWTLGASYLAAARYKENLWLPRSAEISIEDREFNPSPNRDGQRSLRFRFHREGGRNQSSVAEVLSVTAKEINYSNL